MKKLFRGSNFVQNCGPSYKKRRLSDIPNRGLPSPAGQPDWAAGSAFKGRLMSRIIRYIPMKDVHTVDFVWSLPPTWKLYKTKPLHYLGWLVGHEGQSWKHFDIFCVAQKSQVFENLAKESKFCQQKSKFCQQNRNFGRKSKFCQKSKLRSKIVNLIIEQIF